MVYRFKIWFEDMDDIVRIIDIQPKNSFLEFHHIIQDAIGFDRKEPASFFVSDDRWRKLNEISADGSAAEGPRPDSKPELMEKSKLRDWINDPHQRFIYISDYVVGWTLLAELQSIYDDDPKKSYPFVLRSEGKAPRQREDNKFKLLEDNEFDTLAAKIVAAKGAKNILEGVEEELIDDVEDEDDEEDEKKDDYGFDDLESSSDAEFGMEGFSEVTE